MTDLKLEGKIAGSQAPTTKHGFTPERIELLRQELDEHGVAVLPGVLTEEQCDENISQIHQWINQFGKDGFPDTRNSLVHKYNISHHPVAWHTRLQAAPVFEALWGTEKLASSFDGMAIGQPPELGVETFATGDEAQDLNLHLDQGGRKVGLHAYQGAVYLEEALEDDWSFAVMDGSHLHHQEYYQRRNEQQIPEQNKEHLRLTGTDIDWYINKGCPVRRIAVPKGGMVLWDSRTVHSGARPLLHRKNPGRWRYVVFACMAPAAWASQEVRDLKKSAFRNLRCSRHWPVQGFELFDSVPASPELNAVNELPVIALTEKVRLLAGDQEYAKDGRSEGPPKPLCV